jgi:hypothetical protein
VGSGFTAFTHLSCDVVNDHFSQQYPDVETLFFPEHDPVMSSTLFPLPVMKTGKDTPSLFWMDKNDTVAHHELPENQYFNLISFCRGSIMA